MSIVNIPKCKVILNVNPAKIAMQTTIFVKTDALEFPGFEEFLKGLRTYIPNYNVVTPPVFASPGIAMVSVKIMSSGDYFSDYVGNLDVINCAAVEIMNKINKDFFSI
jgi:acetaldehyde dehydrogenase